MLPRPKKRIKKNEELKKQENMNFENEENMDNSSNLSPYEKMIMQNRLEQMKFLESIKLNEVRDGFYSTVNKVKHQRVKIKRHYVKSKASKLPSRRSRRLANLSVDLSENGLFKKALEDAEKTMEQEKPSIPKVFTLKEAFKEEESSVLFDSFSSEIKSQFKEFKPIECIKYKKSIFQDLKLSIEKVAKVLPVRATCIAVHPQPQNVLICAGSKYGNLGFWNVLSDCDPFLIQPHASGITNMKFNPYNSNQLITSSYDGSLRCGDMEKEVFEELFNNEEACLTYFDFLSCNSFIVSRNDGKISIVDVRYESKCLKSVASSHICHERSVKMANIHPVEKSYFVTCDTKGLICLWDLRKLQKNPLQEIDHHKKCVHSAFFSPLTGKYILSTSTDDTLAIFDSSTASDIKLKSSIRHNNWTGRWLTPFRGTWLPNTDEFFTIGSMESQRKIQVFNDKLENAYNFIDDNLNSVTSVHVFHPCMPVLAGANSSGKVFVFMN